MPPRPPSALRPLSPVLVNAEAMARQYPETFGRPDPEALASVAPGWFVKVAAAGERFWIHVQEERTGGVLVGTVANDLLDVGGHGLRFGDCIAFSRVNAYDVEAPD